MVMFFLLLLTLVNCQMEFFEPCRFVEKIKSDINGTCINKICVPNNPLPMFYSYTTSCETNVLDTNRSENQCDIYFVLRYSGVCDENFDGKCYSDFGIGYDPVCDSDDYEYKK